MKYFILPMICFMVPPSFAKSLDAARAVAAKIEAALPEPAKILCEDCDADWIEGGTAVHNLEVTLENLFGDERLQALESNAGLAPLLAEHIGKVLIQPADPKASYKMGTRSLCSLSKAPCQLFRGELFVQFCAASTTP